LGVEPFTQKAARDARQHALSVLGSGRVTVTLNDGSELIRVARTAEEDFPRITPQGKPIVLSQDEIESIGVDARGRLRLIDDFTDNLASGLLAYEGLVAQVSSVTSQLEEGAREIRMVGEQITSLPRSVAPELPAVAT